MPLEIDICKVVHANEAIGMRPWRLRNQFVHVMPRWHVGNIISDMAFDGIDKDKSGSIDKDELGDVLTDVAKKMGIAEP